MRLLALSDLHVNHAANLAALAALPDHPDDTLILAGDVADRVDDVARALDLLGPKFRQLLWVPGNHELWTVEPNGLRGEARYRALVDVCRVRGVLTPEDPFAPWPTGDGRKVVLCPLFLLYDYTFAPDGPDTAVAWAAEDGIRCVDEQLLHPDPYPSRAAWCAARVAHSEARLAAIPADTQTILIAHWPLRRDLVRLFRIPRFIPWCGTLATEDWHVRYRADCVVTGHLHMRATDWRDGVRFEEVSLGTPRHWTPERGAAAYLRQILPAPPPPADPAITAWHR
jgi:3',5'-cyclic AMP phosphodiesterase CpdA